MARISKAAIKANYRLYWYVKGDDSYWPLVMWRKEVIEAMHPDDTITHVCLSKKRLAELLPTAENL